MSKITATSNFSNSETLNEIVRWASQFSKNVFNVVNGNLEFDINMRSSTIQVAFGPDANTNTTVTHRLNRQPIGYILAGSDVPCHVYNGTLPKDKLSITIKCDAASANCTIIVF